MIAYSRAIDRAVAFAATKHREQQRKGGDVPYIAHPVMVGMMLSRVGLPDDVVVAGLLHDVVEDQDVTVEEVEEAFGTTVAQLVASVTERKTENGVSRPWKTRKQEQLAHLETATEHGAALKAADALHNCLSTVRDLEREGAGAWARFRAPRADQLWYYSSVASRVRGRLGAHPLTLELEQAVDRLRGLG